MGDYSVFTLGILGIAGKSYMVGGGVPPMVILPLF